MSSTEESTPRRQEPRRFTRSSVESLLTLGSRYKGRSKKSEMSTKEKDHAHLSEEVYKNPDDRKSELRGYYIHHTEEIPADGRRPAIPLNGQRWAVYRAPDAPRFVLAFRGTKITNRKDRTHSANLMNTPFGKHKYIMDAAAWSLQVMLFLASQCDDSICLKFSLTGHSLGGTVAMGALFLLHDVPVAAQYLEAGRAECPNSGGLPDYETYARDFLGPWNAAKKERTGETSPYEIVGGDIFNPGAWPGLAPGGLGKVLGGIALVYTAAVGASMATLAVATSLAAPKVRHRRDRRHDRDVESIDSLITTHHILGDDVLSTNFGLGREKSYGTKSVFVHTIKNFTKEER